MAMNPSLKLKRLAWILGGAAVLLAAALAAVAWSIRSGVETTSAVALREYPGDRVLALISYAESEGHAFRDRNRAVWALGRLRDARALPMLERHYVGEPCNHESTLCQRELRKAITLIRQQPRG